MAVRDAAGWLVVGGGDGQPPADTPDPSQLCLFDDDVAAAADVLDLPPASVAAPSSWPPFYDPSTAAIPF